MEQWGGRRRYYFSHTQEWNTQSTHLKPNWETAIFIFLFFYHFLSKWPSQVWMGKLVIIMQAYTTSYTTVLWDTYYKCMNGQTLTTIMQTQPPILQFYGTCIINAWMGKLWLPSCKHNLLSTVLRVTCYANTSWKKSIQNSYLKNR